MHLDLYAFSATTIYLVCFLIVLIESGVFFMFFLPGDSLLFSLGLLANQGVISLSILIPLLITAAIIGNFLGYYLGTTTRSTYLNRPYFNRIKARHMDKAEQFYEKHGSKAVVLSRFVPVLRTFVPFLAGIVCMRYHTFSLFSVIGALLWIPIMTGAGYYFGQQLGIKHMELFGLIVITVAVVATPLFLKLIKKFFS